MKTRDILAAIAVAVVWGLTFIAIKIGVGETTPLTLSALRFVFAALPVVFFVRPPKAPLWIVALYGLFIGVGQFGLLFVAIRQGFPVGLASLVIQLQAFFTIFLAWALMRERPRRAQLVGAGVAFLGIALIGSRRLDGASLVPFLMVIAAAAFWGAGNIAAKFAGRVDMLAFVTWSSLAAPAPSVPAVRCSPRGRAASPRSLIPRSSSSSPSSSYPTPARCSVLVCGRACCRTTRPRRWRPSRCWCRSSAWSRDRRVFGEPLGPFELWGALLVMAGLGFNVFGDRLLRRWLRPSGDSCTTSKRFVKILKPSTRGWRGARCRRAPSR